MRNLLFGLILAVYASGCFLGSSSFTVVCPSLGVFVGSGQIAMVEGMDGVGPQVQVTLKDGTVVWLPKGACLVEKSDPSTASKEAASGESKKGWYK